MGILARLLGTKSKNRPRHRSLKLERLEPRVLLSSTWFVDDVTDPLEDGSLTHPFDSIQEAIAITLPGDTISVGDGTYTEDLVIAKAGLTVRSQSGRTETTIQLVDGVGIDVQAGADGLTLGGGGGSGFEILSGPATTRLIQLVNAPADVTVSHNTIDTTGSASTGISVGSNGATGLTISWNDFAAELGDGSISGPKVSNAAVTNNTFTGPNAGA